MLPFCDRVVSISRDKYLPLRNRGIPVSREPTTIGGQDIDSAHQSLILSMLSQGRKTRSRQASIVLPEESEIWDEKGSQKPTKTARCIPSLCGIRGPGIRGPGVSGPLTGSLPWSRREFFPKSLPVVQALTAFVIPYIVKKQIYSGLWKTAFHLHPYNSASSRAHWEPGRTPSPIR